ncbi:MAG: thioredoxin [Bacilli bacterium]|jgi:thioredoxin 1|nr:thioredoxin [Acholeplasmataceae bacterium]HOA78164.1 thioredoxin [Bacilli bacterium]HPZ26898.1 thioredoxin [Bacilli bacterium]HQC89304.1 thioredoxin [Bacilli bacterium]
MIVEATAKEVQKETGLVLVDFYADWCGPCKILSPIIEQLSGEIDGVKFMKVNVDNERDFAIENRVSSIPTLVLYNNGAEVARRVGFAPKETLQKWINEYRND